MDIPTYLSGAMFMQAYRVLRVCVATRLEQYDLTPTSWVLLGVIKQHKDGVRLSDTASSMNVKAPLITNMVHELSRRGYVARITHHSDKRAKLLTLTSDGKQFIKLVEGDVSKSLHLLLEGLNETDIEAYVKVLNTIISNDPSRKIL